MMNWIDLIKTVPIYVAVVSAAVWLTVIETEFNGNPIVRLEQVSQ